MHKKIAYLTAKSDVIFTFSLHGVYKKCGKKQKKLVSHNDPDDFQML